MIINALAMPISWKKLYGKRHENNEHLKVFKLKKNLSNPCLFLSLRREGLMCKCYKYFKTPWVHSFFLKCFRQA